MPALTLADVAAAPHSVRPFHGPETTISTMVSMVRGNRGERSVVVHNLTQHVVRGLQPKDYLSEILAVRNFVAERCRYKNDPLTTELVQDPERLVEDIARYGKAVGDCDDIATLMATMLRQLGRDVEFVTVGFDKPGQFTHVFVRCMEPKSKRWIVCDPVAGTNESRMLARVKTWKFWRID